MNYYPFHIGDYLSATRHLSWEEDAAYRRLLDTYYTTEKPLPLELRQVCRLVLATTDAQREAVQTVLEEFFERTEEGWINSRADAEIHAMREKQQKQRDKANKRWHKQDPEHGNASAMPQHESEDATASKTDADAMPPTPTPTPTPIEDKSSLAANRRKRIPVDFEPNDTAIDKAKQLGVDVGTELPKFIDYHTAKGSVMVDWQAAFRTWLGNARPSKPVTVGQELKYGSDEYFEFHRKQSWWADAGFGSVWEAVSSRCNHKNFREFSNGQKIKEAV